MNIEQIAADMRRSMAARPDGGGEYANAVGRIRFVMDRVRQPGVEQLAEIADILAAVDVAHRGGEA